MPDSVIQVFFYGLFMDTSLLASRGVKPRRSEPGHVEGYRLHIGERATLLPSKGDRSYGVLMEITPNEAGALYSDESVRDYVAEPVVVHLRDGRKANAACYNLPASKLSGENRRYAADLLVLATRLGMPESYIARIRSAATPRDVNAGPS